MSVLKRAAADARNPTAVRSAPRVRSSWRATLLAGARRHKSALIAVVACAGPLVVAAIRAPLWSTGPLVAGFGALAWALPRLVRREARIEDAVNLRTARVLPARLLRPCLYVPLIAAIGCVVGSRGTDLMPTVVVLSMASAQMQAFGMRLAYKGKGDRLGNTLVAVALGLNLAVLALAVSAPGAEVLAAAFALWFGAHLMASLRSDLRSRSQVTGGVGVFFGTFNPVHKTHLAIMADATRRRGLQKIYVHPTTVPKLHRAALANGEIDLRYEHGMRVYHRTPSGDPAKDYFPTGNRFFDYAARNELLKAGIEDACLSDHVEVLDLPDVYDAKGFSGVLAQVRQRHPATPIHGLHGSDPGGMWVRALFDAAGYVRPYPVRRRDGISATAIRAGGTGMATPTVERFLAAMRAGMPFTFPSGRTFAADGLPGDSRAA